MVTVSQVSQVLLPWLGSRLLSRSRDMTDEIVRRLNRFLPGRTEPEPFCNELAVLLYGHVLRLTDRRLIVQPDGGFPVQMRTDDFNIIADDLLFLIFNTFPVDAAHLLLLQEYAMARPCLSALRALYERFAPLQSPAERSAVVQIIRSCYPPWRIRSWLNLS